MPSRLPTPLVSSTPDPSELARLRTQYAGRKLQRDRLWHAPMFEKRRMRWLLGIALLANLLWIVGLDQVMQPIKRADTATTPIRVSIIVPEVLPPPPPEPEPVPAVIQRRESKVVIEPPKTELKPPPLNTATSNETQARIGAATTGPVRLFNADGSMRLPEAPAPTGPESIANPIAAGKARWADLQVRGENPLDCKRTRFAKDFARDESLGDKVSRKYLKWIGLADGAGIAERAAQREQRAADGCDPAD